MNVLCKKINSLIRKSGLTAYRIAQLCKNSTHETTILRWRDRGPVKIDNAVEVLQIIADETGKEQEINVVIKPGKGKR